ncbi:unnamed protein product [Didymodactylos carnosus]|uniref:Uncharacterized protein n=1 Tax=Didymodactylos carnosus TaxID=1234261 RepID=A0A813URI1_9BILA|nr:unnamed protein product [Didymodactylos carnosus]CAF0826996.1 unnamed protein product [Didymodactylos carnosus]CAF3557221.1 unnamed protein product [Didymodactylos carnosus]CAF3613867.1 unnamed protein product [Didymodactylos carnosus]
MKKTHLKKSKHRFLSNKSQSITDEKHTGCITSAEPINYIKTEIQLGCGTAHLDQSNCLKTKLNLKTEKQLKRDLLRVTDQRPSLLGSQTLHPSRSFPTIRKIANETSNHTSNDRRRSSSSLSSINFNLTPFDRIGPWPDKTINRLRNANELLHPSKNFRNRHNIRLFSPKYYATMSEQQNKFTFYSNTKSYIDEYRKRKGYILGGTSSILSSQQNLDTLDNKSDDDQLSVVPNQTRENSRTFLSTETIFNQKSDPFNHNSVNYLKSSEIFVDSSSNDLLSISSTKNQQSIRSEPLLTLPPITTKQTYLNDQLFSSSSISMRNGHLRPMGTNSRTIPLPSLPTSRYSNINQMGKTYAITTEGKKFENTNAKLFVIESRPVITEKKKYVNMQYYYFSLTSLWTCMHCIYETEISFPMLS